MIPLTRNGTLLLQSITMRRLKSDKVNGQPIITLPPKTIDIKELDFTPEEMDFYESMEKQSQARFLKYVRQNFRQNYHHILVSSSQQVATEK